MTFVCSQALLIPPKPISAPAPSAKLPPIWTTWLLDKPLHATTESRQQRTLVPPMTAMKRNVKMTTQTKQISAPSLKSTTRLWSYIAKQGINHQKQKLPTPLLLVLPLQLIVTQRINVARKLASSSTKTQIFAEPTSYGTPPTYYSAMPDVLWKTSTNTPLSH